MKLKHLCAMIVACRLLLGGCESESIHIWDEESRIKTYVNWMNGVICRQMVDNLDFLFQASAYRDSLLCGGYNYEEFVEE